MTKDELRLLHSYLDSSKNYLEFGSGESTIYASNVPTIQHIDSVESSERHVREHLQPNAAITCALLKGKLVFHIIDIGETLDWGYPYNENRKHLWPNYSLSVFTIQSHHDLVLVDGRFRVACTLSCILNTPEDCNIMIHDFWNRPEYHIVLKYLRIKDKVDTLGVFSKKQEYDPNKLQSLIKTYQYIPDDKTIID